MFAAAAITFREAIEAGLVVGVLAALTRGLDRRGAFIALGIGAGLLASFAMAALVGGTVRVIDAASRDLFNAGALALAVLILHWHALTAATRGGQVKQAIARAGAAARSGGAPMVILATVAALAVFREGTETVLLVYGLVVAGGKPVWLDTGLGVAAGLAAGAVLSVLVYAGLVRLSSRWFFGVVHGLMALLAAAMAAQAAALLQHAGFGTALAGLAWDSSAVLPQKSMPGHVLHIVFGYAERPSELQVIAYGVALVTMVLAGIVGHRRSSVAEARAMALPIWRYEPSSTVEDLTALGKALALASAALRWLLTAVAVLSLGAGTILFVSAAHDADQVIAAWLLLGGSVLLIGLQTHAWWRATRA